jgi:plastocyanin
MADTVTVYTFNYNYSQNPPGSHTLPDDPTINVGDTVQWVVTQGFHTVTSVSGSPEQFDSGFLTVGNDFSYTFMHDGLFWYYCTYHGGDTGSGTAVGMAGFIKVVAPVHPDCPADLGVAGGAAGQDGQLDNNDFVVFIDDFFAHDVKADVGTTGGLPGADGAWNNNDFIVYIDLFFQGCP